MGQDGGPVLPNKEVELLAAGQPQLDQHVPQVGLHRVEAQKKFVGNLGRWQAVGQMDQHLQFAGAEVGQAGQRFANQQRRIQKIIALGHFVKASGQGVPYTCASQQARCVYSLGQPHQ